MTSARRSAGLRRVSTATFGLVAASVTGAAVVTVVVAHQGVHHAVTGTADVTDDQAAASAVPQSPAAQSPAAQSPAAQSPVQSPVEQLPAQQTPVQELPGGPAPVVGPLPKHVHHHAVTSGS